jgi:hypothetical protein
MPLKNTPAKPEAPKALAAKPSAKAKALALAQTHFLIQKGDCLLCGKKLTAKSEAVIDTRGTSA